MSGIIALFVGKKRKKFEIHRDLLIAKSTYFQAALAADWEESRTKEVYWDDEDLETVSVFVDWLYRLLDTSQLRCKSLLFCYELAHKRDITGFKNDVMDAFRRRRADRKTRCHATMVRLSNDRGLSDTPIHDCILRSVVKSLMNSPKGHLEEEERIKRLACTLGSLESCQLS